MTELTHDPTDDGFHEIHLSGKQLVFLFMATTVVCVAIFLLGVLVGRGVRSERGQELIEASAAPATETPTPATTPQPVADAGPPSAEPPAPTSDDELSYHKRLEGDAPPAEDLKAPAQAQAKEASAAASPKPAAAAPASAPASAPSPASEPATGAGRPGAWVVQLVALRDRSAAGSIVTRLTSKGYPAFVVNPAAGSPAPVFKVQVGRYNDRREAEQVARRLEKEEQFKPWISR